MAKVIVGIGYRKYVVDVDKAVKLIDMISDAEIYEDKWHPKDDATGATSYTTYHIFQQETNDSAISLTYLSTVQYNMWKLAGKPSP